MESTEREVSGVIKVEWVAEPYGRVVMEANYILYQKASEDFSDELDFVREHFQQLYDSFLEHEFAVYQKYTTLDVWNEETCQSERIEFSRKEDIHPYLGMEPSIDIKSYEGRVLTGLSFYRHNRMSIEHGLCAVFDKLDLVCADSYDFLGIINNFQYGYTGGLEV